eukprot:11183257-Lingulodinium_polyedra.AAC.1
MAVGLVGWAAKAEAQGVAARGYSLPELKADPKLRAQFGRGAPLGVEVVQSPEQWKGRKREA